MRVPGVALTGSVSFARRVMVTGFLAAGGQRRQARYCQERKYLVYFHLFRSFFEG